MKLLNVYNFLKNLFGFLKFGIKSVVIGLLLFVHVLCIRFYMNKTSNPIYMVVNRSIINSRSSRKRG